jgi:lipopolysaccharide/colanic/teichoic acid biosynthesis glycosyltransferase
VPFVVFKLRTMRADADDVLRDHLAASPDAAAEWQRFRRLRADPRLIPGARVLRGFSIDELPQLWNVLRGDMSLVGPRPLELPVVEQLPGDLRAIRDAVRPGITGLWQVSGRSEMDIAALARVDAAYVRDWSIWKDVAILLRTPAAVLSRRGAY